MLKGEKTKEELLKHYSERDPVKFIQYDVFTEGFDDMVIPDEDGDSIWSSQTQELMTGLYTIRVLIRPDIAKEVAIRGLEKTIERIKRRPELLQWASYLAGEHLSLCPEKKRLQKGG